MKRLLLAAALCTTLLNAADTTEDFFYNNGYEQGERDGFKIGVKKTFAESKKIINEYREEIKAYELGKFLIKGKYLTAPKVYQVMNDKGEVTFKIIPSRLQKELNVNDIFAKFGDIPTLKRVDTLAANNISIDERNSVNISSRDEIINLPNEADKNNKILVVSIKKNKKNQEKLKNTNAVYSLDKDNNRFKVMFFSRTEKSNFCNSFKICR